MERQGISREMKLPQLKAFAHRELFEEYDGIDIRTRKYGNMRSDFE